MPMWMSDQAGKGSGMVEGVWNKCFNYLCFFFFFLCPLGKEALGAISCCQITSTPGMGDGQLMMP